MHSRDNEVFHIQVTLRWGERKETNIQDNASKQEREWPGCIIARKEPEA